MKLTRAIYYIIFNKHIKPDGRIEADNYQLEIESAYQGKIPESITLKDKTVTVVFTDGDRHIFPYNENCEYFDKIIKPKTYADKT
jgi:hypothetical protein